MIWNWSVKGRTSTSVVPMSSGNGEEKRAILKALYPSPPLLSLPLVSNFQLLISVKFYCLPFLGTCVPIPLFSFLPLRPKEAKCESRNPRHLCINIC